MLKINDQKSIKCEGDFIGAFIDVERPFVRALDLNAAETLAKSFKFSRAVFRTIIINDAKMWELIPESSTQPVGSIYTLEKVNLCVDETSCDKKPWSAKETTTRELVSQLEIAKAMKEVSSSLVPLAKAIDTDSQLQGNSQEQSLEISLSQDSQARVVSQGSLGVQAQVFGETKIMIGGAIAPNGVAVFGMFSDSRAVCDVPSIADSTCKPT